MKQR
jgi:endo-1,4-beta-mannosidase